MLGFLHPFRFRSGRPGQVYLVCPLPLFAAACAPIPVIAALRWHLEKLVGRLNTRGRKLTEAIRPWLFFVVVMKRVGF